MSNEDFFKLITDGLVKYCKGNEDRRKTITNRLGLPYAVNYCLA